MCSNSVYLFFYAFGFTISASALKLNITGLPEPYTCEKDPKNTLKTICSYNYNQTQASREISIGCIFEDGQNDDVYKIEIDGRTTRVSGSTKAKTLSNTCSLKRENKTVTCSSFSLEAAYNLILEVHFNYIPTRDATTTLPNQKPKSVEGDTTQSTTEQDPTHTSLETKSSQSALWILWVVIALALFVALVASVIYYRKKVKRSEDISVALSQVEQATDYHQGTDNHANRIEE